MYTKFSVKDGKVSWNKEKGKKEISTFIGDDFNIAGYKINTDTSRITTKLQVFSIMAGKMVDIEVDRATVNAKQLAEKLKANFCTVLDANAMYSFFLEKEACLLNCWKETTHILQFLMYSRNDMATREMINIMSLKVVLIESMFIHIWDGKI